MYNFNYVLRRHKINKRHTGLFVIYAHVGTCMNLCNFFGNCVGTKEHLRSWKPQEVKSLVCQKSYGDTLAICDRVLSVATGQRARRMCVAGAQRTCRDIFLRLTSACQILTHKKQNQSKSDVVSIAEIIFQEFQRIYHPPLRYESLVIEKVLRSKWVFNGFLSLAYFWASFRMK